MPAGSEVLCDASVVLKWFHAEGEEEVEASRALLDLRRSRRLTLSVLDLTAYELGNALIRGLAIDGERVASVLAALDLVCPRLTLTLGELTDAAALATAHRLTMYDAAYAAAAVSRHVQLATLDRALLEAGLARRPSEIVAELR